MEFNPKFLHFLPCHGFSHSSCKPFLGSPATMKLRPVLFALPRDDEEFSSDNKEEPIVQDDHTSISPDDVHNEQSKKVSGGEVNNGEFVVREATTTAEFYASAMLRAKGLYPYDPHDRGIGSAVVKHTVQEGDEIVTQFKERNIQPYMCIIAVGKEGENNRTGLLKYVMGTLEFSIQDPLRGKTYPEEVVTASKIKTSKFKQRKSRKYGIISKMAVAKSAGQQDVDVGSSMLKFAIESAKDKGIKQVFLLVSGDNKQALALYVKMGIKILELPRDDEEFSSDNEEPIVQDDHTSISSDDVHKEQSKKVSGDEVKKVEFVVREVTDVEECWASARLKSEVNYQYDPCNCDVDSCKKKNAKQEFGKISKGYMEQGKFMCIIAVRKERENVPSGMPEKSVMGTLNFEVESMYYLEGKRYPEKLVNPKMPSIFLKRGSEYGMLKRVAVDISARKQGIGRSMLKFVIEHAKENGIPHLFLHVRRDNTPALALYERMGFKIVEEVTAEPYLEMNNAYLCRLNL